MSDEPTPDQSNEPGSVFGNLPSSRPGTRSPRRDRGGQAKGSAESASKPKATTARPKAAAKPKAAAAPKAAARPKAAAKPKAQPKPPPQAAPEPAPQGHADAPEPQGEEAPRGGIEDLAWAGIAAAAEAATLGVRLASRAMGAVRDSVDRR